MNARMTYALSFLRFLPTYHRYRRYSMVGRNCYLENLALAAMALRNPSLDDAAIVECGTWRGGMAAGLIEVGGPDRSYFFFDSFEGLPPPGKQDGQAAQDYQRNTDAPEYLDNCSATLAEFQETIARTHTVAKINIRAGFFEQTLPHFNPPPIAILRLDGDWYASTMICLETFWDHVLPGGLILIDDYFHWEGCTRAVHDFLSKRGATECIRQGRIAGVANIRKK